MRPSPGMIAANVALGVMIVVGVVFHPVLTASFLDRGDAAWVRRAAGLASFSGRSLQSAFTTVTRSPDAAGYYQPLAALSLAMDARLTSEPAAASFYFHLTNLVLHALNVALVFAIVRRLSGGLAWPALLSLLFGLHPAQVESVAWVTQRMTLLATFFSLSAVALYLRYARRGRTVWLLATTLLYVGAVLSQPLFLGLPILLLAFDLWPLRRNSWWPLIEKVPMFAVMLAVGVVQLTNQHRVPASAEPDVGSWELMAQSAASFFYRMAWPANLSPFYPVVGRAALHWPLVKVVGFLAGAAVLFTWSFRRARPLFVALAGAFVFICPALLNVAYTDRLLGDAYLYPILIAPIAVLAAWIGRRRRWIATPAGRWTAIGCACLLPMMAVRSYAMTFDWQSSREQYAHAVRTYPQWSRGYCGLVEACLQDNDLDEALNVARRAVAVDPRDATSQFYLGTALLLQDRSRASEAIAPLQKALQSNGDWIACLQNLGVAYARSGSMEKAIGYLERARSLQPDSPGIRLGLGHAYLEVHRPASARKELAEALKRRNDPYAHLGLARAWAASDSLDLARRHLSAALAKDRRVAARAAAAPELTPLRSDPDFRAIFDSASPEALMDRGASPAEMPATRSARGS